MTVNHLDIGVLIISRAFIKFLRRYLKPNNIKLSPIYKITINFVVSIPHSSFAYSSDFATLVDIEAVVEAAEVQR